MGDFFLDAYFDCDPQLNEPSIETGRTARQVVRTRRQAGAAGTVVANLAALGCAHIEPIGYLGDDGEGFELRRSLDSIGADTSHLICAPDRVTPTYAKPCIVERDGRNDWLVTSELERLDIKNRRPTPRALQSDLISQIQARVPRADATVVVDQVSELNCGVLTTHVRGQIEKLARNHKDRVFIADSRERIGLFKHVSIKPNLAEAQTATRATGQRSITAAAALLRHLRARRVRPCFCTLSTRGILVDGAEGIHHVAGFPVAGPIDPVGAGDSVTAALAVILASGGTTTQAALIANLVASVTVQQIGTTGTARPSQVIERYREVSRQ